MKAIVIFMSIPILLTVGFGSCDKENYPTYRMEADFKDYVLFPVGSYWVYNQEGNIRRDSIYLFNQIVSMNETRKIYRFNYEQFVQNMSSSYYKDTLVGAGGAEKDGDLICFLYTEGFLSTSLERNLQFYTKHDPGSTLDFTESMRVKYTETLNTYSVNGHQYNDVKVFESTIIRDALMTRKIYYARGVGVIRKELFNGQVWNLQRYKVN
jgi:hypothetical protein